MAVKNFQKCFLPIDITQIPFDKRLRHHPFIFSMLYLLEFLIFKKKYLILSKKQICFIALEKFGRDKFSFAVIFSCTPSVVASVERAKSLDLFLQCGGFVRILFRQGNLSINFRKLF